MLGETAPTASPWKIEEAEGKAFRPWCWSDSWERKGNLAERTSHQEAELPKPWPTQWGAGDIALLEEPPAGRNGRALSPPSVQLPAGGSPGRTWPQPNCRRAPWRCYHWTLTVNITAFTWIAFSLKGRLSMVATHTETYSSPAHPAGVLIPPLSPSCIPFPDAS